MSKTKASICVMIATIVTVMTLFFLPEPKGSSVRVTSIREGMLENTSMLDGVAVYENQQPLVAPVNGQVEHVYVQAGENVHDGDLLIRLDAQAEMAALRELDKRLYELNSQIGRQTWAEAAQLATTEYLLQLQQQRASLVTAINLKQIRASRDGVVENIYVQAGDMVGSTSLLGMLRGEEICISALWSSTGGQTPQAGMAAWLCDPSGTPVEPLQLESVSTPLAQETGLTGYQLVFRRLTMGESSLSVGDRAPVRLILSAEPSSALVPLAAVDSNEQLWLVQNGTAIPLTVELGQANDEYIQAPNELAGSLVILQPDAAALSEGARLKTVEAK